MLLTRDQQAHLRQEQDLRNADGYWMCVRIRADDTPCRNVRSFFTTRRFNPPLRMPDEVD